jgi:hypothetical protein
VHGGCWDAAASARRCENADACTPQPIGSARMRGPRAGSAECGGNSRRVVTPRIARRCAALHPGYGGLYSLLGRRKFPARSGKIPCSARRELALGGHNARINAQSGSPPEAPRFAKFPAKFPALREFAKSRKTRPEPAARSRAAGLAVAAFRPDRDTSQPWRRRTGCPGIPFRADIRFSQQRRANSAAPSKHGTGRHEHRSARR